MKRKIRVAVIGCGQISDAHLSEISLLADAEVVAVCDLIKVLAEDSAERFNVRNAFSDYSKMIGDVQPDVVHITTPPHTHLPIAEYVLRKGCHAYIEKPFGINLKEAKMIIETAQKYNRLVCAGFSQLYDIVAIRAKNYIHEGKLGEVVHLETFYGDSLDGNFSKLFLRDKGHWIHRLPGKLFQNVISHALYHIVPFFPGELDKIVCLTHDRSNNGILEDELRVMMRSGNVTGCLTYTNAVRPLTQFFRVYGTKSIIHVDLSNRILTCMDSTGLPGPIARVRNAVIPGKNLIREGMRNIKNFITGHDRFFAGMGSLFDHFYQNIRTGSIQPPVPYYDVLKHSEIMDEIAHQSRTGTIE